MKYLLLRQTVLVRTFFKTKLFLQREKEKKQKTFAFQLCNLPLQVVRWLCCLLSFLTNTLGHYTSTKISDLSYFNGSLCLFYLLSSYLGTLSNCKFPSSPRLWGIYSLRVLSSSFISNYGTFYSFYNWIRKWQVRWYSRESKSTSQV